MRKDALQSSQMIQSHYYLGPLWVFSYLPPLAVQKTAKHHAGQSSMVGNQKAVLEQALAKVMNLGLNCKQVMGPVYLPSNTATFIPLYSSMDLTILWTNHNKLGVWGKLGLQCDSLAVSITPKHTHHHSLECINQMDEAAIGGDEDELAIIAELKSCPLTSPIILYLKCRKWPLIKRAKIIKFDHYRIDTCSKN